MVEKLWSPYIDTMPVCIHCDETTTHALFGEADEKQLFPFCCQGCLTVFQILHEKNLGLYYDIKGNSEAFKRRAPVTSKEARFDYLDGTEFLEQYSYLSPRQQRTMEFYLEGIHCLACLWLIEKIPEFVEGVLSAKLDVESSIVTVVISERARFGSVAREFNHLGYRPHPLKKDQDAAGLKTKEERKSLIRIAVAGAAAGNIMIYAVSLYGGASGELAQVFNALTVAFAVPVLSYSAYPFYKNSWQALKNRTLSIDIPISIALLMGAAMGTYNLLHGIPENYFDSLTSLVFLLLLSRYFLQKIQSKGLSGQDLQYFYQSESVLRADAANASVFREIHPRLIRPGDTLKVRPGEIIPADGVVTNGISSVNASLLTGESAPVPVATGEEVYSGTQNLTHDLVILVQKTQENTRLGEILKSVESGWAHKSHIVGLTHKISKSFTLVVFTLASFLFIRLYLQGDPRHAFEQAMTLLIVTCPCALALATPLTMTRALTKASGLGIIIKNDEVIEKISKVENVFIDKTGTLTYGQLRVTDLRVLRPPAIPLDTVIFHLERDSQHPVAKALVEAVKKRDFPAYAVTEFMEKIGVGVRGVIAGNLYEINGGGIFENQTQIATYQVSDTVRPDSLAAIQNLRLHGLGIKVLSGDRPQVVAEVAAELGILSENAVGGLTPEEKAQRISSTPLSLMVGDGANDAVALGLADVGVAVYGSMDISLRAADAYLTTPGLAPLEKLVTLSRETMKVIRRNLVLSLLYNSLSVILAFTGKISPLTAAIIMPVSSLTVLVSGLLGTKKMRQLWKC